MPWKTHSSPTPYAVAASVIVPEFVKRRRAIVERIRDLKSFVDMKYPSDPQPEQKRTTACAIQAFAAIALSESAEAQAIAHSLQSDGGDHKATLR